MKKEYEVLPHTADLRIRAYGKDLKELFKNMLKGMFESLKPAVVGFNPKFTDGCEESEREIEAGSHDCETLLVNFLSEALYLSDVNKEAYLDADISDISDCKIKGVLKGTPITNFGSGEIKAVTHHGLYIKQVDDGYIAEVIFDL